MKLRIVIELIASLFSQKKVQGESPVQKDQSFEPMLEVISQDDTDDTPELEEARMREQSEIDQKSYAEYLEAEAIRVEEDQRAYREYHEQQSDVSREADSDESEWEKSYDDESEEDDQDADRFDEQYDDFDDFSDEDEEDEDYESDLREALFLASEHAPDDRWRYDHLGTDPLPLGDEPKKKSTGE